MEDWKKTVAQLDKEHTKGITAVLYSVVSYDLTCTKVQEDLLLSPWCQTEPQLQIRMGNRDNLGIIIHIFP